MQHGTASVIVARNGKAVLPELLDALTKQSDALQEIIVVDNASADGTCELLKQHYPAVTVIPLAVNEGVSGGYSVGLEHALRQGHDWVWMLDQDSRPSTTTLKELLAACISSPEYGRIGIVAPLPVNSSTGKPYPLFLWKKGQVEVRPGQNGEALTLVDMVISSGSLIRSDAVRKVGLPRRDFFMDFVDY
jgi:rhamnopyranosyl-N-acetylglucosaminyl-diphospho-decaprenol beta-1,3/1,4-galactofuranosyltransferase